ncbi:MAG: hypothetical protein Q8N96_06265 [Methylovulum sp.]|nr:hypothetical protein [Methylovulum sp.]
MTVPKCRPQKKKHSLNEASKPKFPAAGYFQVHFQHIESQLDLTNRNLDALQQQILQLQACLGNTRTEFELSQTEK